MEPVRDPYAYDQHIADEVLLRLTEGWSLRRMCAHEGMPPRGVVLHWLATNPDFEARYFRAREVAMEAVADDLYHWAGAGLTSDVAWVAGDPSLGQITQAHRTRIAVKQWLMAHWAAKTYGPRSAPREASDATRPAPAPSSEADPDIPRRISPRPFAIAPIEDRVPSTIGGLPLSSAADLQRYVEKRAELHVDDRPGAPPPSPRPSRRQRRAVQSMMRKHRASSTNGSRAPPP
jgi:hypothetical protein